MGGSVWWWLAARIALALAVGLLAGWPLGYPGAGASLVLGLTLVREFWLLRRVRRWLMSEREADAPDAEGTWGDVITLIARVQRRRQYHKRRLLRLLRELRRATGAIPDGVVMLNPLGEILWFNRTAVRLLHLHPRSDIGLRIENLVRQPEFVQFFHAGDYTQPLVVRAPQETPLYLQIQIVPYGAGQLLMLVRDVTRAEQLEAMRKDFVANASHELRSPLTVIAGYLETFSQDPALDPQLADPINEMRRQSTRMTGIIEDLLTLSRLEAAGGAAIAAPIDVGALIAQLRRDIELRVDRRTKVLSEVESQLHLLGDEAQVHSAFGNLLENAAKYTPAGGTISMRWWSDATGGHFTVQDTGIGIAREHIPRLTERFYRVDAGRSRATGGSGLGLAIVKHVLQRHGATLHVDSREGQGSTFRCDFPPGRIAD
jgi:two-component system, OmpR family, phosphate regulon sensor histidine kinase PhoR